MRRDNRPSNIPGQAPATRPPQSEFRPLFAELMKTRWQYEVLRSSDGSLIERALLMTRLQELRAELAQARRSRV